jgi:hypothetical protein
VWVTISNIKCVRVEKSGEFKIYYKMIFQQLKIY